MGIVGPFRPPTREEMQRRAQARGAGGYTRAERRKTKQRKDEAIRLAARRLARR